MNELCCYVVTVVLFFFNSHLMSTHFKNCLSKETVDSFQSAAILQSWGSFMSVACSFVCVFATNVYLIIFCTTLLVLQIKYG